MPIKTIFLDRDGVINKEKNYLYKIEDFEFINGVFQACLHLNNLGYKIIIVTNQSGISRGYYSIQDLEKLNDWILSEFKKNHVDILDVFYCPHIPSDKCKCRKPKPGMFFSAKDKHNINMKKSWVIGDSERDITAASLAGITNSIIVRSGHKIDEKNSQAKFHLNSIKDIKDVIKL